MSLRISKLRMTPERFDRLQHAVLIERNEFVMAGRQCGDILDTPHKRAVVGLVEARRISKVKP